MPVTVKLVNKFPLISAEMRRNAGQAVRATALRIETTAKESMAGPKSGRIYPRSSGEHQASAPGEAPAIDTGALVNSVGMEMVSSLTAQVGTDKEYGLYLEYGTARVAARPWLTPAVEQERDGFVEAMRRIAGR